jgi:amino acid transporter
MTNHSAHRPRGKPLGTPELIAIALGGMIGGGIFTILGISVEMIGSLTPIAIIIGGALASLAAYSYVKLALYYKDEGATYSFFKRTFTDHPFAASLIGWFTIFGYISTLALLHHTPSVAAALAIVNGYAKALPDVLSLCLRSSISGVSKGWGNSKTSWSTVSWLSSPLSLLY